MLNSEGYKIDSQEREMPKQKKTPEGRKRIYNPVTGTYYSIRLRSSKKGEKGTIKGKWKTPSRRKRKKRH